MMTPFLPHDPRHHCCCQKKRPDTLSLLCRKSCHHHRRRMKRSPFLVDVAWILDDVCMLQNTRCDSTHIHQSTVSRQKDCSHFILNGLTLHSDDSISQLLSVEQVKKRHAIHSIFILFRTDIACQVRNSVRKMLKGPTGGVVIRHFRHAIRPFL